MEKKTKVDFSPPYRAEKYYGHWCVVDQTERLVKNCDCRKQAEEFAEDLNNPCGMSIKDLSLIIFHLNEGITARSTFSSPVHEYHEMKERQS